MGDSWACTFVVRGGLEDGVGACGLVADGSGLSKGHRRLVLRCEQTCCLVRKCYNLRGLLRRMLESYFTVVSLGVKASLLLPLLLSASCRL
jgi:hypothetical protein